MATKCCSPPAEHFGLALMASQVTSPVAGSSVDEVTFAVGDSFAVTVVEMALGTGDCFHVAVWQVSVSNSVSRLELVVLLLVLPPSDFRSSAACHDPFDEASERDCGLARADGRPGSSVGPPSSTDVDSHSTNGASLKPHADFVVSSELAAAIGVAVERCAMIPAPAVELRGSSTGVGAGAVAAAAVDDSEVFVSGEIVGFAGCQSEECRRDLD